MKNIHLLGLLLLIPILAFPQKIQKRCEDLKTRGKTFHDSNRLDSALVYYLDAINCNPRMQGELGPKLLSIFDRIEAQRKNEYRLRKKAETLLGYFFEEGVKNIDEPDRAAWVQGPNDKYAVINWDGDVLPEGEKDPYVWEEPHRFENHRAIAKRGGLYYFVDNKGEVIKDGEGYDLIHKTNVPQLFGIYKTTGEPLEAALNPITGKKLNNIRILKEGSFRASNQVFPYELNKKWGLMNQEGKYLEPPIYEFVANIYGGFARVNVGGTVNDTTGVIQGGKWGFINGEGKLEIDTIYTDVGDFVDKVAWVKDNEGFYGLYYLDEKGKLTRFTEKNANQEDIVVKNQKLNKVYKSYFSDRINKEGFIDTKKISSNEISNGDSKGNKNPMKLLRYTKPGKSQLIQKYRLNDLVGYKDNLGNDVIEAIYDQIEESPNDSLVFKTQQRALHGLIVLSPGKNSASTKGYSSSNINKSNFNLSRYLACDYDEIGQYRDDLFDLQKKHHYVRVKQEGKWGYVFWDFKDGKWEKRLIPCQYDVATDFYRRKKGDEPVARIYIKDFKLYFYINIKGEMLGKIERDSMYR